MRRFLALMMIVFALTGCTTIRHATNPDTPDSILTAQDTAMRTVYAFEAAFQATPPIVDALLQQGKISKATYNSDIVPAYNRGLAALDMMIAAVKSAQSLRQDPTMTDAWAQSLALFLTSKQTLDNLVIVAGGTK